MTSSSNNVIDVKKRSKNSIECGSKISRGIETGADSHRSTVKPRYSAPAFNMIPPIEHINLCPKKCFHSYLYVGNKENLGIKHNFDQSLEMRYSGV